MNINKSLLKKWPFLKETESVPGYFSINESIVMHVTIQKITKPCTAVEIGSLLGKSACVIAKSFLKKRSKLYCIDPFLDRKASIMPESFDSKTNIITGDEQLENFKNNLTRLKIRNKISIIRKFSAEAANSVPEKVDFIFIDGSHKYKDVLTDYLTYEKKLKVGGFMALHDVYFTNNPKDNGPYKVVKDKMMNKPGYQNPKWICQVLADCLFIAKKMK